MLEALWLAFAEELSKRRWCKRPNPAQIQTHIWTMGTQLVHMGGRRAGERGMGESMTEADESSMYKLREKEYGYGRGG